MGNFINNPAKSSGGTVTTVSSPTGEVTVSTGTTTPKLEIAKVPAGALSAGTLITLTTTSKKATIAALEINPYGNWVHTYWYSTIPVTPAAGTAMTKGRVVFSPFIVATAFTAKGIAVHVVTAVATTTIRLGIYNDTGHGKPGSKVLDATTVASTAGGTKTVSLSTHVLTPGQYWLAAVRQGTSAIGTLKCYHAVTTGLKTIRLGCATAFTSPQVGWRSTGSTHTGALPTTAGTVVAVASFTQIVIVQVKSA